MLTCLNTEQRTGQIVMALQDKGTSMKFEITIAVLLTIGASVWIAYLTQGMT
jgi:hypothetical protein